MIDNFAIFLFSVLIVYTIFRAIQLDITLPWFTDKDEHEDEDEGEQNPPPRKDMRR